MGCMNDPFLRLVSKVVYFRADIEFDTAGRRYSKEAREMHVYLASRDVYRGGREQSSKQFPYKSGTGT